MTTQTQTTAFRTDAELLAMTPQAIAKIYRTLVVWIRAQPEDVQYYGVTLRRYLAAWRVAVEAAEVRP